MRGRLRVVSYAHMGPGKSGVEGPVAGSRTDAGSAGGVGRGPARCCRASLS